MRVREKGDRGVVQSVVLFLGVSALSGALAAGLAIPFAGLAGFATEQTHETIQHLPQEFNKAPLKQKSTILAADGSWIATLAEKSRTPVKLSQVAPIMRKAMVAIEDDRFYEHGAMDLKGTLRALLRNQTEGSVQQGGSSITQQYVKMSLIEKARTAKDIENATAETYQRKITELRYAIAVEKQYSKDEILEMYLNLANFGDGAWGVEAASVHYFGVHAKDLSLPQAAMLAGLVKNPTGYDPTNNMKRAKDRRDVVIKRMLELKIISTQQANNALRTPVLDKAAAKPIRKGCANSPYPFYCEYVVAHLKENPAFGKTKEERENFIMTAGLTIRTSLDPKLQRAAQASIDGRSDPDDEAIAAVTIVEPGTGLVKAMAQSKLYGGDKKKHQTSYNYNVEKSYAGGYGGFQNGSTMKAFTIAAAIQKGLPLSHRINSPKTINLTRKKFTTCDGSTMSLAPYSPSNSTAAQGNLTMIEAAKASTNTYFLQLSQQTGLCAIARISEALGLYDAQTQQPLKQVVSMTLGVGYVTPLQMANAYATFAARGMYCKPWLVTSVKNSSGKTLPSEGAECKQALAPEVADGVNEVLHQVMEPGGTGSKLKFGRSDLAGKTGTIQKAKAVWYAGYSSKLAAASVVADATLPYDPLRGQTLNGRNINDPTGSGTAGPIWRDAMQAALKGYPTTHFTKPDEKTVRGNVKDLPALHGMNPEDAANRPRQDGFDAEIDPKRVNSPEAEGTVAYTTPRQRDGAPEGSKVTIHVSNGQGSRGGDRDEPGGDPTTTTR